MMLCGCAGRSRFSPQTTRIIFLPARGLITGPEWLDSAEKMMDKARKYFPLPEYQLLPAMGKMKLKQYEEAKKIAESVAEEYPGQLDRADGTGTIR